MGKNHGGDAEKVAVGYEYVVSSFECARSVSPCQYSALEITRKISDNGARLVLGE